MRCLRGSRRTRHATRPRRCRCAARAVGATGAWSGDNTGGPWPCLRSRTADAVHRRLDGLAAGRLGAWQTLACHKRHSYTGSCCAVSGRRYAACNRLGALRSDHDIFQTFEGDNTVLMQQVRERHTVGAHVLVGQVSRVSAAYVCRRMHTSCFQLLGLFHPFQSKIPTSAAASPLPLLHQVAALLLKEYRTQFQGAPISSTYKCAEIYLIACLHVYCTVYFHAAIKQIHMVSA